MTLAGMNRRAALVGAGAAWLGMTGLGYVESGPVVEGMADRTPLAVRARRRGLDFGYMLSDRDVSPETQTKAIVDADATIIVPGLAMKWNRIEDAQGNVSFDRGERYAEFAKAHRLKLRGHTAFWYRSMPDRARQAMAGNGWRERMLEHVGRVVGQFRGRVNEWDVVNEAIEPKDKQRDMMRLAPFGRPMDSSYVADCFHAAHAADPAATLFYNEYGVETADAYAEDRRRGVLKLLEQLQKANAPIHALGVQGHLTVGWHYKQEEIARFLREVAAMGLSIRITELDVCDKRVPGDAAMRDLKVADCARYFLDAALDVPEVNGVVCWGVSDVDSWMRTEPQWQRIDREPLRPCPYDDKFQRKPLWHAIGAAIDACPARRPVKPRQR